MKKLLLLAMLLCVPLAHAQIIGNYTANKIVGGTKPTTCNAGPPADVWVDTTVTPPVMYVCGPSNTLNALAGGGGGGAFVQGQPVTANSSLAAVSDPSYLFVDQFAGATGTNKLDAAITSLGTNGGHVIAPFGMGAGLPTTVPNNILMEDYRQSTDVLTDATVNIYRPGNILIEGRQGELTGRGLTGTVTFTNGSTTVTGVGTAFTTQLKTDATFGSPIKLTADATTAWDPIATITDDTHLTLTENYTGVGGSGSALAGLTPYTFVIRSINSGGSPHTASSAESVGEIIVAQRVGATGSRALYGFNVQTLDQNALRLDTTAEFDNQNNSGTDFIDGNEGAQTDADGNSLYYQDLRLVGAGTNKTTAAISMAATSSASTFQRGISMNNAWWAKGIYSKAVNSSGVQLYLVPAADNSNSSILGQNAADSATVYAVRNDGSGCFQCAASANAFSFGTGSGTAFTLSTKINAYDSLNGGIAAPIVVENDEGGAGVAAIGFSATQSTLSGGSETRSAKAGIGLARSAANGRGLLNFYNRATNDTADFAAADIQATLSNGGVFNATTGFQVGGAAASNNCLLGNGTNFVGSANCLLSGGALGTPSSGTATNITGLPLSTGVTGVLPNANGGAGIASGSAMTTSAMTPQSTATPTAITGQTWSIGASKNYILNCYVPITLAASATVAFSLVGPGTPTSVTLMQEGAIGAASVWAQKATFLAATWAGTATGASGAVATDSIIHVWGSIQNGSTASGTALTLDTIANGTNNITVGAGATCTLNQVN